MGGGDRRRFKKRLSLFQCGTYDASREPGKAVPMGVSSVHLCTTSVEVATGRGDFDEERMRNNKSFVASSRSYQKSIMLYM